MNVSDRHLQGRNVEIDVIHFPWDAFCSYWDVWASQQLERTSVKRFSHLFTIKKPFY